MDTLEEVDVSLLVLEYVVESVESIQARLGHSGTLNISCTARVRPATIVISGAVVLQMPLQIMLGTPSQSCR